jgi:hypothetical protein
MKQDGILQLRHLEKAERHEIWKNRSTTDSGIGGNATVPAL